MLDNASLIWMSWFSHWAGTTQTVASPAERFGDITGDLGSPVLVSCEVDRCHPAWSGRVSVAAICVFRRVDRKAKGQRSRRGGSAGVEPRLIGQPRAVPRLRSFDYRRDGVARWAELQRD